MPIFDQGYQHWEGKLAGPAWRWWAITLRGFRTGLKNKWVRSLLFMATVPAVLLVVLLALWGLIEQRTQTVLSLLEFLRLPDDITADPSTYRNIVWTLLFSFFFSFELFLAMLIVLMIGPDLISQDLRFNAIPLYFSKPVRRIDYFIGKLGVMGMFIALVMVAPAIVAWVFGVAFSLNLSVIKDTFHLVVGSVLFGLVVVVSSGMLMLAISSLSKNSRMVGAIWIGLFIVSSATSAALVEEVRQPWCYLVSYGQNLAQIQYKLLGVREAWQGVLDLQTKIMDRAMRAERMRQQQAAFMQMGNTISKALREGKIDLPKTPDKKSDSRKSVKNAPQPPTPPEFAVDRKGNGEIREVYKTRSERRMARRVNWLENQTKDPHPWWWSAAVLSTLLAVSMLILTRRVKSLDKLR